MAPLPYVTKLNPKEMKKIYYIVDEVEPAVDVTY